MTEWKVFGVLKCSWCQKKHCTRCTHPGRGQFRFCRVTEGDDRWGIMFSGTGLGAWSCEDRFTGALIVLYYGSDWEGRHVPAVDRLQPDQIPVRCKVTRLLAPGSRTQDSAPASCWRVLSVRGREVTWLTSDRQNRDLNQRGCPANTRRWPYDGFASGQLGRLLGLTLTMLKMLCINHGNQMSQLDLSASFEYLCYGFLAIINILLFQYRDRL